jgi:hypothetical protein
MPLVLGTSSGMPGRLPGGPTHQHEPMLGDSKKARWRLQALPAAAHLFRLAVCCRAAAGKACPPAPMPPVLPATAAGDALIRDGGTCGGR